jgi:hypothetical protein
MIVNLIVCSIYIFSFNIDVESIHSFQDLKNYLLDKVFIVVTKNYKLMINLLNFKTQVIVFDSLKIIDCVEYIEKTQAKYPLACSTLEISRNWDVFVNQWFNKEFDYLSFETETETFMEINSYSFSL